MAKWKNKESGLNSLRTIALLQKAKENGSKTKVALATLNFEKEPLNIPVCMRELVVNFVPGQIVYLVYRGGSSYLAAEKPLKTKRTSNGIRGGITAWWVSTNNFELV